MKNLVDKLDGILEFEKEDNVVYLNKVQRNIIKDLFELKQNTTQNWSEILEDFPLMNTVLVSCEDFPFFGYCASWCNPAC